MLCWMNTKPAQTLAVYALHRGKTLAEIYAPGIKRDTPLPGWSMAKSVVNALVGILVKEGRLKLHDPLPTQLWQGKRDGRSAISMHHLLQMSSGLPWTERYWWSSDVTRMLFTSEDVSQGITAKPYRMPPGDSWQYASGTTNVISKALRQLLGEAYHDFPYQHLFAPLGMHSALMETDACGNFVGSSYMLGSAADWAKLGLLYAQDGIWKGKRILPEGWVKYSTTPAASAPQREYGAHFWLNLGTAGRPETRKMPDVPGEVFYASGFGGQRIFIVPSQDLVIVRLGAAHFREPDFNALLSQLLADFSSNRIKF
jgi:CubicO group peptidase (beta-lactamase class C family)